MSHSCLKMLREPIWSLFDLFSHCLELKIHLFKEANKTGFNSKADFMKAVNIELKIPSFEAWV